MRSIKESDLDLCVKCKIGILEYRKSKFRDHYRCSNYLQCDSKQDLKSEPPPRHTDAELIRLSDDNNHFIENVE